MFNKTTIQTAAADLVGFNKSVHPFYKRLSGHKTSDSGYWVNALPGADFSTIEAGLLTEIRGVDLIVGEVYKIRESGGDFTNVGAADNNVGTTFTATGTTPTSWGNAYLQLISCNQYLDDVYNEEVTNLVSKFIRNSKAYLKQGSLLSNHSVIGGVADMSDTVTKSGRFVGFVLEPHEGNNVVNTITKLGFLGDAADSGLKLYLYESSQDDAIATFEFNYAEASKLEWKTVTDFIVKYNNYSSTTSLGGVGQKYILGYFEDDLTCNAIPMEFNQSLKNFSVFGRFMSIYPVAIPSANLNGYKLPSDILHLADHIDDYTHGLYFTFTAECDYTNLIYDNIDMFAEPLQYAIALRILEDAVASVSDGVHNPNKDASLPEWRKLIAKYSGVLNGGNLLVGDNPVYQKGLIELLTMDFSNIDTVCFKSDPYDWYIGNMI